MTFDIELEEAQRAGLRLTELREMREPSGAPSPLGLFRCWFNKLSAPPYIHGVGWGSTPVDALRAARRAYAQEEEKHKGGPKALSAKPTLTMADLTKLLKDRKRT